MRLPTAASAMLAVLAFALTAYAQEPDPVTIKFDPAKDRTDLVTGRELPAYTEVERGSIRFHRLRLDEGDTFVNYTHDGFRTANIADLHRMEKVQERFAIWRLRYKRGNKNTPRIQHQAISFVPLSPDTGERQRRVYIRLSALELIDWGTDTNAARR